MQCSEIHLIMSNGFPPFFSPEWGSSGRARRPLGWASVLWAHRSWGWGVRRWACDSNATAGGPTSLQEGRLKHRNEWKRSGRIWDTMAPIENSVVNGCVWPRVVCYLLELGSLAPESSPVPLSKDAFSENVALTRVSVEFRKHTFPQPAIARNSRSMQGQILPKAFTTVRGRRL